VEHGLGLHTLPPDLPEPEDDGAAEHLPGMTIPALPLAATTGGELDLGELAADARYLARCASRPLAELVEREPSGIHRRDTLCGAHAPQLRGLGRAALAARELGLERRD